MTVIAETLTAAEVAERFRCGPRKITEAARKHGIGVDLEGRAGWRFTEADVLALWESMRPAAPIAAQKRRRA